MCNDEDSMTVTSVVSNSMLSNSIDALLSNSTLSNSIDALPSNSTLSNSMPSNSIGAMLSNSMATTIEFDRCIAIEIDAVEFDAVDFDAIEFDRLHAIEFDGHYYRIRSVRHYRIRCYRVQLTHCYRIRCCRIRSTSNSTDVQTNLSCVIKNTGTQDTFLRVIASAYGMRSRAALEPREGRRGSAPTSGRSMLVLGLAAWLGRAL